MGAGASSRKSQPLVAPTITVVNDGGVVTKLDTTTPAQDESVTGAEAINPTQFLSPGQAIVRDGLIWKLNLDADPDAEDQWMRRRMWLTDSGGLFYYSSQYGRPVGRSVTSLTVKSSESRHVGRFVFELQSVEHDADSVSPTLLAADSVADRDGWVQALNSVLSEIQKAGSTDDLDPLEPIAGRSSTDRRRLSKIPSVASAMKPSSSKVSYNNTLRASLANRLSMPPADRHSANITTIASLGPSAFGGDGDRPGLLLQSSVPAPMVQQQRRDSQAEYSTRDNTVLILDWDDTLFPTTFVRTDCGLDWRTPLRKQVAPGPGLMELEQSLAMLSEKVEAFLHLATSMAKVVIVTLAKRPWVETSALNFMPDLAALLKSAGIEVIYARETLTVEMKRAYKKDGFRSSDQEADFWMKAKALAMLQQFRKHHDDVNASWKNIISIGDSNFERLAVITVTEEYFETARKDAASVKLSGLTAELTTKSGQRKRLRTKVVKLLDEPALEEMIAQSTLLLQWLPHIVQRDSGFDIAFEDSWDDARLNELHRDITGAKDEKLSWRVLAGLDVE